MNANEHFVASVKNRLASRGISVRAAALELGVPVRSLYGVLSEGQVPTINRAAEICDALDIEFYIGPPRGEGSDLERPENLRGELEVIRKAEAQTEALRTEIASMAARLEASSSPNVDTKRRIRESELIIPTLILLATRADGVATTRDIIRHMEYWFQPAGEDAETLKGRKDSRFSQIVRNMISHRKDAGSFINNGYAEYLSDQQGLKITDKGRKLLKEIVNEG